MHKVTGRHLLMSLSILLLGAVGGSLIVRKMANGEAVMGFFRFALAVVAVLLLCQCLAFHKARTRLPARLLFLGLFGYSMLWFMLSVILPVFWISAMGAMSKCILAAVFAAIHLYNLVYGWLAFRRRWTTAGAAAFEAAWKPKHASVDWDKVQRKLGLAHHILIPAMPHKLVPVAWVVMLVCAIAGLFLKSWWPAFSAFSWTIPVTLVAAFFNQLSGSYFAQAVTVRQIEHDRNLVLKCAA